MWCYCIVLRSQWYGCTILYCAVQVYDYLIVIDFESTCWQDAKHRTQEISKCLTSYLVRNFAKLNSNFSLMCLILNIVLVVLQLIFYCMKLGWISVQLSSIPNVLSCLPYPLHSIYIKLTVHVNVTTIVCTTMSSYVLQINELKNDTI